MKLVSNYYSHILEPLSNHFDSIELSIIFIFYFLIIFHIIIQQIVFEKILDKRIFQEHHNQDVEEYQQTYKKVRYYLSKIIILNKYLFFLVLATYEFIKYSENILQYSSLFSLIVVTFVLREVVLDFFGWLGILFGRFYFFGDRIKLGNIVGDVIDIGFFRTTLLECGDWVDGDLYNGRIVRIANSLVFKEPVYNYNSNFKFLWDEIKLSLTHESDYEKVQTIIKNTVKEIPIIEQNCKSAIKEWNKITNKYFVESAETSPLVSFSLDRNAIEFTIRYVVDYKKRRTTKNTVLNKILLKLEEESGKSGLRASIAKTPLDIWLYNDPE